MLSRPYLFIWYRRNTMKGLILAGGKGTRLYPSTKVMTKQLLPIYDRPMIYYPISLLMLAGIKEMMIISSPEDLPGFKKLLGSGEKIGVKFEYKEQAEPRGIPEAFLIGEEFIAGDDVVLILGDNLFYGDINFFRDAIKSQQEKSDTFRARIFGYPVANPSQYGVLEFDKNSKKVLGLEEKPQNPKSKYAIPGLYLFDSRVAEFSKKTRPSARGELEIIDVLKYYLDEGTLGTNLITRGVAWLDMGTPKSLLEASSYIAAIEERQGLKVACLEEVALRMNFITLQEFENLVEEYPTSPYQDYLKELALSYEHI